MSLKKKLLFTLLMFLGLEHLSLASENDNLNLILFKRGTTATPEWTRIPLNISLQDLRERLKTKGTIEETDLFEREGFPISKEAESSLFVGEIIKGKLLSMSVTPKEELVSFGEQPDTPFESFQMSSQKSLKRSREGGNNNQESSKHRKQSSELPIGRFSLGSNGATQNQDYPNFLGNEQIMHIIEGLKLEQLILDNNFNPCPQRNSIIWKEKIPIISKPRTTLDATGYYTYDFNAHELSERGVTQAKIKSSVFSCAVEGENTREVEERNFNEQIQVYITALYYVPKIIFSIPINEIEVSKNFTDKITSLIVREYSFNEYLCLTNILKEYGYYCPREFVLGGKMYSSTKRSVKSYQHAREVSCSYKAAFTAKFKISKAPVSVGAGRHNTNKKATSTNSINEREDFDLKIVGGIETDDPANWLNSLRPYQSWNIIKYEVVPIINILGKDLQPIFKSLIFRHWADKDRLSKSGVNMKAYRDLLAEEEGVEESYREMAKKEDIHGIHAQLTLGILYRDGQGVPQNHSEAKKWFQQAAEKGNSEAKYSLGVLYRDGARDVPQNYLEAKKWFEEAAAQGNIDAQYNLGALYHDGQKDIPKNYPEAIKWYQKAADQGNTEAQDRLAEAQYKLGILYYNGQEGIPQSYQTAREWYQKAAEQGRSDAQYSLGYIYLKGLEVLENYPEAKKWFQKSLDQGYQPAQRMIEACDNSFLRGHV